MKARMMVVAVLAATMLTTPANAATLGCAQPDADKVACREAGWIMRPRVHVSPRGWVRYLAPKVEACPSYESLWSNAVEDAPCFWNDGDGAGESYVALGPNWFMIVNGFRLGGAS